MHTDGADTWGHTLSHVVGLCSSPHGGYCFLLDTELGVVYWIHCPSYIHANPSREPLAGEAEVSEDEAWRSNPAWAVEDSFELLKGQFRSLNFAPTTESVVVETQAVVMEEEQDVLLVVKGIWKDHCWPDMGAYKKQECLEAAEGYIEEDAPLLQYSG
ncbi:uncharacterized protein JN550_001664 [Neoarthrinium moseri]|uniref:uncharacterized protein n=1 Tax=Neoarthrinium moseri TaxID=1658444 RepID=UPI001FDD4E1E|nr:uncharacterized protein JN550_001664 [Neoarthrinium moseri]KAI1876168.1 hypothetical protein JN550_001664 [Neoarthrinium moseri]